MSLGRHGVSWEGLGPEWMLHCFFPTFPLSPFSPACAEAWGYKIRHDLGLLGAHRPMGETNMNKQMPCGQDANRGHAGSQSHPPPFPPLRPMCLLSLSPHSSSPSSLLPCCSFKLSCVKLCPLKRSSSDCQKRIFQAYSVH